MKYKQTIQIPKDKVKEVQEFLNGPGQGTLKVEYSFTADFGDGIEADIKVCDAKKDSTPYVDPVIFDNGQEVMCIKVRDTLLGEYTFYVDNQEFVVIVEEI